MKKLIFLLLILFSGTSFAQLNETPDTLNFLTRILGPMDSVDYKSGDLPTTFESGQSLISPEGLSNRRLQQDYFYRGFTSFGNYSKQQFSAIPYLGFAYTFGTTGSQFLKARYVHAFKKGVLLNIKYDRNAGNGYLRNAVYRDDDVEMSLSYRAKRFSLRANGMYQTDSVLHPGGVNLVTAQDSNILTINGLEFVSVNKQETGSKAQRGKARLQTYLNILRDSARQIGITSYHDFKLFNRRYQEINRIDSLFNVYDSIYIDSTETRDKYNYAQFNNGLGVYFSSPKLYVDGIVDYGFWRVNNLNNSFDSTELNVRSTIFLNLRKVQFKNQFKFNIFGNFNEFCNRASLNFWHRLFDVSAFADWTSEAPVPFKRSFVSNNFKWSTSGLKLQNKLNVGGSFKYKATPNIWVSLGANYLNMNNVYLYQNQSWQQDATGINSIQLKLRSKLRFGVFNIHPAVTYSATTSKYLPDLQAYLRMFVDLKLFKAKKLALAIGVEGSYITNFTNRSYVPAIGMYNWNNLGNIPSMGNASTFVTLGLSTFRFYVRYENFGALWNNRFVEEMNGYPIPGGRIRFGITWDFFN